MKRLLLLIIVLAALLRFVGVNWGYPPYHSDEGMSYEQGVYMIIEGTLDAHGYPHAYAYPNVVPITNAFFFKFLFIPLGWARYYASNIGGILDGFVKLFPVGDEYHRIFRFEILGARGHNVLIWGRHISALVGVGVVYLSYRLGKNLFGATVGIIAALLVAINYRQVLNSHLNLPDIYNAFFLMISLIISYSIVRKPTLRRYVIAGIFAGIFFSTKFQIYAFISLLISHFYVSRRINLRILIAALAALIAIIVINPYHLMNIEETLTLLKGVSGKYQIGSNSFYVYPYYYLIETGIGRFTSLVIISGVVWALFSNFKKAVFLLSVIIPFFIVLTYLSRGGFYTRNFVTITPLLLIFAGFALGNLRKLKNKRLGSLMFILIMTVLLFENLPKSLIVASEYRKPWNYLVLSDWLTDNVEENSKIAAHSSVPLPVEGVERLPYEFIPAFSIEEFRELGADYAIANLDWVTNEFYGWMGSKRQGILQDWGKPSKELEKTYSAMTIRELSDFAVYWAINPWEAPESHFIVAKIPRYEVNSKDLDQTLALLPSNPIVVSDWEGFYIEYDIETITNDLNTRDGYLYLQFYESESDAVQGLNRTAVRLSSRNNELNIIANKFFTGEIPKRAKFMTIDFGVYNEAQADVSLGELKVYRANLKVDYSGVEVKGIKLEDNLIFPISHGNL